MVVVDVMLKNDNFLLFLELPVFFVTLLSLFAHVDEDLIELARSVVQLTVKYLPVPLSELEVDFSLLWIWNVMRGYVVVDELTPWEGSIHKLMGHTQKAVNVVDASWPALHDVVLSLIHI